MQIVKRQVTERVVRWGDYIPLRSKRADLKAANYHYLTTASQNPPAGWIYNASGSLNIYVNGVDADGISHTAAIPTIPNGSTLTIGPQSATVVNNPGQFSPNVFLLSVNAWPALANGDYAVTVTRKTYSYALSNGAVGSYLSSPDDLKNRITGDIDIRASIAADDWTPAALDVVVAKWDVAPNLSYRLNLTTAGLLQIQWSENGTVIKGLDSTVAPGIADGTRGYVRATLDVNNGAAGHTATFYTSLDDRTWTQLGASVTDTGVTSIFAGTAALAVLADSGGSTGNMAGKLWGAKILNGIDGAVAAELLVSRYNGGTTIPSPSGEVWTINGGVTIP
jgi:hypothetical protein